MLASRFRFHGHGSVRSVYRKGRAVRGTLGSLHVLRDHQRRMRVTVVVSRKVARSAVIRNRIRRRLYEAIRLRQADLPPAAVVLTVYLDAAATMPAAELQSAVDDLLRKAGLQA